MLVYLVVHCITLRRRTFKAFRELLKRAAWVLDKISFQPNCLPGESKPFVAEILPAGPNREIAHFGK
jgi:hypothetical protein